MRTKTLLVLYGPTAVGKTATAVQLARHFDTEILSADSRQFYKEMEIGTAVPEPSELLGVPHHFLQHLSVHDSYTAGDFEKDALALLEQLFLKHDLVIMTGGSNMFINAVLYGLDEFPEADPKIREALNDILKTQGIGPLQKELLELDPEYYQQVDLNNPHRLIRALEVCKSTHQPYSSFRKASRKPRPFRVIKAGLQAERETLYERINLRVDLMMERGLLEEVRGLYPLRALNALQTVGYRELFSYFEGSISLQEAVEEIKKNSRRYAKRQLTWMRKDEDIRWFAFNAPIEALISWTENTLKSLN